MKSVRLVLCLVFATGALAVGLVAASGDPEKTRQLLAVVQKAAAPLDDRAHALQQLALVATPDAVPALVPLLADEKLGQYARDVLELMPDASAAEALRAALGNLQGRALIGVVNSLGLRRDADAVGALGRLAADPSSPAAGPALLALGRIGTSDALRIVGPAMWGAEANLRAAAAEALLLHANRLLDDGHRGPALAIFDKVRHAEIPAPLRLAATRGAILADESGGLALALEHLRSTAADLRDVALLTLRDLSGAPVTPALVAELDRLAPPMQALVIEALAERGDAGALAAIEARATATDAGVRDAALKALGKIGRASSGPILLAALRADSAVALASLARISAPETDGLILKTLATAEPALRIRLIGVLGERRAAGATAGLMALARGADIDVSKAAFRALGLVASPADLPRLIALALAARDDDAKTLADRAIVTTSMKLIEPARRADAVLVAFRAGTAPAAKAALLRPLGAVVRHMGGSHEVFFVVRAALKDRDESVRDAAVRCLADWPDASPTITLLDVVQQKDVPPARREVALRGAIRMATNVAAGRERSPLNVVECFVQANRAVQTKEDKLMIVSALGNLKRPEGVALLEPYLADPAVQAEAALALVQIAPALAGSRETEKLKVLLGRVVATEKDEDVRRKAARLAKGDPAPAAKAKGKGKAASKASSTVAPAAGALFNGTDLANWDGDPGVWRVRDGAIVGGSLEGNPRNEFLATPRRYRNFTLRLDYKLVGTEGFINGGVQFHSVRIAQPPNEMSGYQADIGAGHSGCLYDESRRKKFLARATAEQIKRLEKPGDWNRYEIRCDGPRVELLLNGESTVTYTETDPTVAHDGLIALQIHGNCKAEIAFRNLEIEERP